MSDFVRSTLHAQNQLHGTLNLDGDLTLTGEFAGTVRVTGELEVAAGARIEGTVEAGSLIVAGRIDGEARAAGRVTLRRGARVTGGLVCASLTIDEGATLEGAVRVGVCKRDETETKPARGDAATLPASSTGEGGDDSTLELTDDEFDATIEVRLDRESAAALEPRLNEPRDLRMDRTREDARVVNPRLGGKEGADADAPPLPEVRIGSAALHTALLRRRTKVLIGTSAKPPEAKPPEGVKSEERKTP